MNGQLAVQEHKKGTVLPASRFLQRAAVRPIADHTVRPESAGAMNESCFGQDFSRVGVHSEPSTARAELAPLRPVMPTRCPYGGACHACPVQVQTKLTISQPGDKHEQEADGVANQVMRMPDPVGAHQRQEDENNVLSRAVGGDHEQADLDTVPFIVHEVLHSLGQPLDSTTRTDMQLRLGHDFSQVRVHTDEKAAESARAMHARAYTVGQDIVFGAGQYAPEANHGRQLLAHELTHVVQQASHNVFLQKYDADEGLVCRDPSLEVLECLPSEPAEVPVNPEIANLPWGRYVDRFEAVIYDLDYRSEGGNLSKWLRVIYSDGTEIDINIFTDFVAESMSGEAVRDSMARGYTGDGGRIYPDHLNPHTTPRLWAARQSALEAMDEYNVQFIMATMPAVTFIITMPMIVMGTTGRPQAVRRPTTRRPTRLTGGVSGFTAQESAIISETRQILSSSQMAQIRAAHAAGRSVTVRIGGRLVQYEPGLSSSGMTMFGENGFVIGREAFASEAELTKTLLHELHRLSTSAVGRGAGASGAAVASETQAAFQFAERAFNAVFR